MSSYVNCLGGRCPHMPFFIGGHMSGGENVLHSWSTHRDHVSVRGWLSTLSHFWSFEGIHQFHSKFTEG